MLSSPQSVHFELVTKFKTKFDCGSGTIAIGRGVASSFNVVPHVPDDPEDRQLLFNVLLHSADLANPVRKPFELSARLAAMLGDEFTRQADRERELGLPVSPLMEHTDAASVAKRELGFIDFVVWPLWEAVAAYLPETAHCLHQARVNRSQWEALYEANNPEEQMQQVEEAGEEGKYEEEGGESGDQG
jgi:hypothetical protein